MFEADDLCDRIAVITSGEIVAEGTPATLKGRVAERHVIEIEVFGAEASAIERVRALEGVSSVAVEDHDQAQLLVVQSSRGATLVDSLLRELDGTRIGRVVSREPTLEDAYVDLVGTA
jgi:ABC-2 type transport system ATP-binding protein